MRGDGVRPHLQPDPESPVVCADYEDHSRWDFEGPRPCAEPVAGNLADTWYCRKHLDRWIRLTTSGPIVESMEFAEATDWEGE